MVESMFFFNYRTSNGLTEEFISEKYSGPLKETSILRKNAGASRPLKVCFEFCIHLVPF